MFHAFIVDDDKYAVEATYRMFSWSELNVSSVTKIYTATGLVERILAEKPHIVFIDIEMGTVSGLDIIQKCTEQEVDSLFVIISGHDNFSYAHTAVNLGAVYYLLKPIDLADVKSVTAKLKKVLPQAPAEPEPEAPPKDLWGKITDYIERNYTKKIQAQDICSDLYISSTTFYNAFRANTNETFIEYLTRFRLEKAMEQLTATTRPIPEIAEAVGFADSYYFSKIFKRNIGMSPYEYRSQNTKR